MKQLVSIIITLLIILSNLTPLQVFAQEGSSSANLPSSIPDIDIDKYLSPDPSGLIMDLNSFDNSNTDHSAKPGQQVKVDALKKRNFMANEKIPVVVENSNARDVKIAVYDVDGREIPVRIERVNNENPAILRILPPRQFKAGRFRLSVTDSGGVVTNQDFTWGVLAINTNKSIYTPAENADISMAVLDQTGEMVCDAQVELRIKNPDLGVDDLLSTENEKIIVNPQCASKEYSPEPDYKAKYTAPGVGTYEMDLTAKTKNGTYSITDTLTVQNTVAFDVERINSTRLYPPITYPSVYNITANQDFEGTITETVPDSFALSPIEDAKFYDSTSTASAKIRDASASADLTGGIPHLSLPYDLSYPITQKFGGELADPIEGKKYKDFGLLGHDGIDFGLPEKTPVLAADDGEVVKADYDGDYGATVVLQHSWGRSYYGHFSFITAQVGQQIPRGHPLGMSGHTGLSSGPHLHFGIKPTQNDFQNGYYGKIDPLPYLGLGSTIEENKNVIFSPTQPASYGVNVLSWNVSLKKGESTKLGFGYKVPNVSPQFYLLGPMKFVDSGGAAVFEEARQWQLAVDADGSGTNAVTPATGVVSASQQTYTFTYKTGETSATGSGAMTISVPSGWTAPQTVAGTAGYTTVDSTSTGTSGDVLDKANSATGWTFIGGGTNHFTCGNPAAAPAVITTGQTEGTGALNCPNVGVSTGDGFYKVITSADWSAYTTVGAWVKTSSALSTLSHLTFSYDDANPMVRSTSIENVSLSTATIANTWVWETFPLTQAQTSVLTFGFTYGSNSTLDSNTVTVDYILIGPGSPVITGSGPWTITSNIITIPANTGTIVVKYGSGGGASGVTNSATAGIHTFTTQSKIATNPTNSLTSITTSPTVTLGNMVDMMRHGDFFSSNVRKPFAF